MSILRSFSKTPKHRHFDYQPKYYSESKLSDSEKSISFKNEMRGGYAEIRERSESNTRVRHQKMMASVRFLVILNLILIVVVFTFYKLFF